MNKRILFMGTLFLMFAFVACEKATVTELVITELEPTSELENNSFKVGTPIMYIENCSPTCTEMACTIPSDVPYYITMQTLTTEEINTTYIFKYNLNPNYTGTVCNSNNLGFWRVSGKMQGLTDPFPNDNSYIVPKLTSSGETFSITLPNNQSWNANCSFMEKVMGCNQINSLFSFSKKLDELYPEIESLRGNLQYCFNSNAQDIIHSTLTLILPDKDGTGEQKDSTRITVMPIPIN